MGSLLNGKGFVLLRFSLLSLRLGISNHLFLEYKKVNALSLLGAQDLSASQDFHISVLDLSGAGRHSKSACGSVIGVGRSF